MVRFADVWDFVFLKARIQRVREKGNMGQDFFERANRTLDCFAEQDGLPMGEELDEAGEQDQGFTL